MDNYLITGYWGEPHVTPENDRGIYASIFGAGRYVLPVGKRFEAAYIGNNTIRIYDGKLIDNGAIAGIPAGEYIDLTVENAEQGKTRNDLIVFEYTKDTSTLKENGVFKILQGKETDANATDPELEQYDLLSNNATKDQMALYRVVVSGANISAPLKIYDVCALLNVGDASSSDEVLDNLGAVRKSGDQMSGALQVPWLKIKNASSPSVNFYADGSDKSCGGVMVDTNTRKVRFLAFNADMDDKSTRNYEVFCLPAPDAGLSASKVYDILTTKTVMYGDELPKDAPKGAIFLKRVKKQ